MPRTRQSTHPQTVRTAAYRKAAIEAGKCGHCYQPCDREGKSYCTSCLAKYAEMGRRRRVRARDAVFDHYGQRCVCCGETEIDFLSIDHINGHGVRKADRQRAGDAWMHAVRDGFPDDLRILCMNCNWGRRNDPEGLCPHERQGVEPAPIPSA